MRRMPSSVDQIVRLAKRSCSGNQEASSQNHRMDIERIAVEALRFISLGSSKRLLSVDQGIGPMTITI